MVQTNRFRRVFGGGPRRVSTTSLCRRADDAFGLEFAQLLDVLALGISRGARAVDLAINDVAGKIEGSSTVKLLSNRGSIVDGDHLAHPESTLRGAFWASL